MIHLHPQPGADLPRQEGECILIVRIWERRANARVMPVAIVALFDVALLDISGHDVQNTLYMFQRFINIYHMMF